MSRELTKDEYIKALKKLEQSGDDGVGTFGKLVALLVGAGAGAVSASRIASLFGATKLLGSLTLARILGGFLVVSTPIGWVLATAGAGASVAYGLSKIVSNGGKIDAEKQSEIQKIKYKIYEYDKEIRKESSSKHIDKVAGAYAILLENNIIEQEEVKSILQGVESGEIDAKYALSIAKSIISEASHLPLKQTEMDHSDMIIRSIFVLLYKHMSYIDNSIHKYEIEAYSEYMKKIFNCSTEYAVELFEQAPRILNIDETLKEANLVVPPEQKGILIESLINIGSKDGDYNSEEKAFVKKVEDAFS